MKDYSQNGESLILLTLFNKINSPTKNFVDLGAGDGFHLSNSRLLKDCHGWTGLMVDADNKGNDAEVLRSFITKENILTTLAQHNIPVNFDLLSVDLDGNDHHIIKEILSLYEPSVIVLEVNSQLPLDSSIVMPYNPNHQWDGTNAYGMSYNAAFKLLKEFDYFVYDIVNDTNIIAVKNKIKVDPLAFDYKPTWSHPEKSINWLEV